MSRKVERPKHAHHRSDGTAKECFTEAQARAKAQEIADYDLDNGHMWTFPVAYPCEQGEHWHVGNANPRQPSESS